MVSNSSGNNNKHKALLGKSGVGKALPLDEPVLTPNGWVRNGDIKVGDLVIGEDGKPASVIQVFPHRDLEIYKVIFNDHTEVRCCKDHLWKVFGDRMRNKYFNYQIVPTSRLKATAKRGESFIPLVQPVEFSEKNQPIDSYTLGFILGSESFTDDLVIKCQAQYSTYFYKRFSGEIAGSYALKGTLYLEVPPNYPLYKTYSDMKVSEWNSLPKEYLYGSIEQRKNLLKGFLEGSRADIIYSSKSIRFYGPSKYFNDLIELARSLGGLAYQANDRVFIKIRSFVPFDLKARKDEFRSGPKINKSVKRIKDIVFDSVQDASCIVVDNSTHTFVTTGYAVTHNSTTIKNLLKSNPNYGLKTASTGIAAINLQDEYGSATTVNSALGYFDTKELLYQSLNPSRIDQKVDNIADKYEHLIIDECSLVSSAQIDLINRVFSRVNDHRLAEGKRPIYLHLVGDFGQLPCIDGKPAFLANCWSDFSVDYLTEVKRQSEKQFIEALHHVRIGDGKSALPYFQSLGFHSSLDKNFQGTTIFSKNKDVDDFNALKLSELTTDSIYIESERSGRCRPEWKNIPEILHIKIGCLVMILMNNHKQGFANGDLGVVEDYDTWSETASVRLLRNNNLAQVEMVKVKNAPIGGPSLGWIKYMPLRVGYSSTTHKSQGLTLDKVQIVMGDRFMSSCHGLFYVALSRCRSSSGLRLVGSGGDFLRSPHFDPIYKNLVR